MQPEALHRHASAQPREPARPHRRRRQHRQRWFQRSCHPHYRFLVGDIGESRENAGVVRAGRIGGMAGTVHGNINGEPCRKRHDLPTIRPRHVRTAGRVRSTTTSPAKSFERLTAIASAQNACSHHRSDLRCERSYATLWIRGCRQGGSGAGRLSRTLARSRPTWRYAHFSTIVPPAATPLRRDRGRRQHFRAPGRYSLETGMVMLRPDDPA